MSPTSAAARCALLLVVASACVMVGRHPAVPGETTNAAQFVDDVAAIFNDSANAPLRAHYGIDTLTNTDARMVVTDDQVCGKLVDATRAAFRAMYAGHMSMDSKELYFYQMGKYYAVMALPSAAATAGTIVSGPHPIMIFTHTYRYITRVDW